MLEALPLLLQWVRTLGHRFFLQFGLHCATHQIRVILISCVVITSLFYPALAIYSSSQPKFLSIFDAFSSPNAFTASHAQDDLVNLWSGHDSIRAHEDAVTRAKCGAGRALRVERIFIQSPLVEGDGALNHRILLSTFDLEQHLETLVNSGDAPCLKRPDGRCFVLSPLAFWNYDKQTLLSDDNILDTLSQAKNISIAGTPVSPPMVLVGRGSYEHHVAGSKFDYATFLALTYFFPDSECLGNLEHTKWVQTIQNAVSQNAVLTVQIHEPTLIALDYDQHISLGWSAISAFLYLAYISFFAYVGWSVRRMDAVHSRLGVTFTALVEIAVSTVTSLSVCALVGFRITMVPWELLPVVIVFVGAENMFNLVDAVGKTSVTLSVKQRIAEGLSRAGTSNTLKVVSYNTILGVIAVFAVGAVRQFCVFAIVVLVAHWFLAHTFFMAVLSIDIARLELEEILRHDTSLVPSIPKAQKETLKQSRPGWQRFILSIQSMLKGRAATNISLLMLLAITATLYYTTYTTSISPQTEVIKPLGAIARAKGRLSNSTPDQTTSAGQIWHLLNPNQWPLLHLRIETPTILTFNSATGSSGFIKDSRGHRTRFSMKTLHFVAWLLRIMVLPIAATTSALYGLLLYLLKNTELLEAQRNRAEPSLSDQEQDEKTLETQICFSTLPRAIASDVELIASSQDGSVVVSVGLHNEIIIWRSDRQSHIHIDAADVLFATATTSSTSSTLTCVTVDDLGNLLAVGMDSGLIAVWVIGGTSVSTLPVLSLDGSSARVTDLRFVPSELTRSERQLATTPPTHPIILASYENGTAVRWSVETSPTITQYSPSHPASVVKSSLLHILPDNRVLVAFSMDDGTLDLIETGDYEPTILNDYCIQPGNPSDVVATIHACRAKLNGTVRLVIAAATEGGIVSLWDGLTGECIAVLEGIQGRINHLRVSPVSCETCRFCGQLPQEALSVAFSVDHIVRFYNLYLNDHTRRCSCSGSQLRHVSSREVLGRRSRSNSNTSSQLGSPMIPRARLATAFETSSFPVSGHGVHSRRASEKDTGRRSSDQLSVPFLFDDHDNCRGQNGSTTPTNSSPSLWQNAVAVRMVDVTCERGGWDVSSTRFFGIRRRPRSQGKSRGGTTPSSILVPSHGLTTATLERWELWVFDPALAQVQSSILSTLLTKPSDGERPSPPLYSSPSSVAGNSIARLPFTRVSPLSISSSHALAGFGNTIGVFTFSKL